MEGLVYLVIVVGLAAAGTCLPFLAGATEAYLVTGGFRSAIRFLIPALLCAVVFAGPMIIWSLSTSGSNESDYYYGFQSGLFTIGFALQFIVALGGIVGFLGSRSYTIWPRICINAALISLVLLCIPAARGMILYTAGLGHVPSRGIEQCSNRLHQLGLELDLSEFQARNQFVYGSYDAGTADQTVPDMVLYFETNEWLYGKWSNVLSQAGYEVRNVGTGYAILPDSWEVIGRKDDTVVVICGFRQVPGIASFGVIEVWEDVDAEFGQQVIAAVIPKWRRGTQ